MSSKNLNYNVIKSLFQSTNYIVKSLQTNIMLAGPSGSAGTDYTREDADYDSTNEEDEETHRAKKARRDLADEPRTDKRSKAKVRLLPKV